MSIIVGKPATDRTSGHSGSQTFINKQVTANASGILTTFEIRLMPLSGNATVCSMGTLRPDGSSKYTVRDYESIGAVTAGSKQTFTGKNCTVVTGDVIGVYQNGGDYETTRDGTETGVEYTPGANGDRIAAGGQTTYINRDGEAISYEATGSEPSIGNFLALF